MTGQAELAGLIRPDGSVLVPAELADEVLRRLVRDVVAEARSTGGTPSPAARRLLDALYEAAQGRHGTPAATAAADHAETITVREMAERMGCSPQYVRALLAAGKLAGRKSGGTWIIHTGRSVADSQASQCDP